MLMRLKQHYVYYSHWYRRVTLEFTLRVNAFQEMAGITKPEKWDRAGRLTWYDDGIYMMIDNGRGTASCVLSSHWWLCRSNSSCSRTVVSTGHGPQGHRLRFSASRALTHCSAACPSGPQPTRTGSSYFDHSTWAAVLNLLWFRSSALIFLGGYCIGQGRHRSWIRRTVCSWSYKP